MVSPYEPRKRPRSVQVPLQVVKTVRHRALSYEPPEMFWCRPTTEPEVNKQEILQVVSRRMIRKRNAWKRIRYAVARIDCWNRSYRRPTLKKSRPKISKIFYQPKPYDTWNEGSITTSTPRNVPSLLPRVEAKPRIDTWLRKPYKQPVSQVKIVNKPIQIQGRSRIDTWMKPSYRSRSLSARV